MWKKVHWIPAFSLLVLAISAWPAWTAASDDTRALVKLPEKMRTHMLANMRDHLMALEEMLAALADGRADKAARIAEKRLGMSSLTSHGAAHMAPFMPKAMGAIGTGMHRAASRFAIIARDAELDPAPDAQRQVFRALQAITENCNACHQAYRVQ